MKEKKGTFPATQPFVDRLEDLMHLLTTSCKSETVSCFTPGALRHAVPDAATLNVNSKWGSCR
jgi:hypothetical protein